MKHYLWLILPANIFCNISCLDLSSSRSIDDKKTILQVCQNKDCCDRWSLGYQRLPESLHDLLPPHAGVVDHVHVESTACFSQCGKGPNLCVKKKGNKEFYLHGITGPTRLADALEENLDFQIPPKLVAAVVVMEKAHRADLSRKDRFYTSAIKVLSSDPDLSSSCAYARALVLRAIARLEYAGHYTEAQKDALASLLVSGASPFIKAQAWRTLADCYLGLEQLEQAIEALENWADVNPNFKTKAQMEISQIQQRIRTNSHDD